jgi:hypothetical protein
MEATRLTLVYILVHLASIVGVICSPAQYSELTSGDCLGSPTETHVFPEDPRAESNERLCWYLIVLHPSLGMAR